MRWLLCPDSFKDAASAVDICDALAKGMKKASQSVEIVSIPLSDGGEGFIDMGEKLGWGERIFADTCDSLRRPLRASYIWDEKTRHAWVGVAEASGIQELSKGERDGRVTTSRGTGILIADALERGARKLTIGLGGSAVNDGGCGMAEALGFIFINDKGEAFLPVGNNLARIDRIIAPEHDLLEQMEVEVLCDVHHVLTGPEGATFTFGPQKGIPANELEKIDKGMQNLAGVIKRDLNRDVAHIPGSGAAGGLGAACLAFLNGEMVSGTQKALEWTHMDEAVSDADRVITGEGKLDDTSLKGKLISGVLRLCQEREKPCYLVCGIDQVTSALTDLPALKKIVAIRDHYEDDATAMARTLDACEQIAYELVKEQDE